MTDQAPESLDALAGLLMQTGLSVRSHLLHHRSLSGDAEPVGHYGGDTVYAIDRKVEPVVTSALKAGSTNLGPITVVAEGFGDDGTFRVGESDLASTYRVLIDPIDGTRGLMYDKRAAWFLAAAAPDLGSDTGLADAVVSVMVELPTSKQALADSFLYRKGRPVRAERADLRSRESRELTVSPSAARTLSHGFGQVSNFFPGTKALAADLMEQIALATVGPSEPGTALIFDDQYICTGGQFAELMCGRDRFCCDLRPIFYDIRERQTGKPVPRGLECHPYDVSGAPLAAAAGVILTDGYGRPLTSPFDVSTPVHWCGYANQSLREQIEPAIQDWINRHLQA